MKYCSKSFAAHSTHKIVCDCHGISLCEARELIPGITIQQKYRILQSIERGSYGVVYLAEQLDLDKDNLRALKFLAGEVTNQIDVIRRFRQEAQIQCHHPNIVETKDVELAEDGSLFITMEYVCGRDLRKVIADGPLEVERVLRIASGIAEGLRAAHSQTIVHRDLKPANIMLATSGDAPEMPKLLDFGIASLRESTNAHPQSICLTPEYASPEQWKGLRARQADRRLGPYLDERVDLYALGGILFEMLTGVPVFHQHDLQSLQEQHLSGDRIPPSRLRPEVANWPGLDALVLKLLSVDPNGRHSSARVLLRDLDVIRKRGSQLKAEQQAQIVAEPAPEIFVVSDQNPLQQPQADTGLRLEVLPELEQVKLEFIEPKLVEAKLVESAFVKPEVLAPEPQSTGKSTPRRRRELPDWVWVGLAIVAGLVAVALVLYLLLFLMVKLILLVPIGARIGVPSLVIFLSALYIFRDGNDRELKKSALLAFVATGAVMFLLYELYRGAVFLLEWVQEQFTSFGNWVVDEFTSFGQWIYVERYLLLAVALGLIAVGTALIMGRSQFRLRRWRLSR